MTMNYRLAGQEAVGKQWRYQKEILRVVETVRCLILEYWKSNDKVRSEARGTKKRKFIM
jgi:hypothetical protein